MTFILKMAWRDSRASRRRLVLFSLSIVTGIAALVAIGSFSTNLRRGVEDQTKALLGADLTVTTRAAPSPDLRTYLDALGGEQAHERMFSSMLVFPKGGLTRLVQVRALEGEFPFYGEFVTEPADAPERLRKGGDVVILEESLLQQFQAKVGDTVKLGRSDFTIIGAVRKVPGESPALALFAPRAYIPMSALEQTGLDAGGPLMRYRTALKLPPTRDAEEIALEMRQKFRGPQRPELDTVERRKREMGRALTNIYAFLSLVGFIALFLGAIGVASAIHEYVRQKLPTVAVLRCLGATARQAFAVYLVQGLALGALGAILGAGLGVVMQLALPHLLKGYLPLDVSFFIAWPAVLRGMGAGLVICLLFTMLPLLTIRRVSPLMALRSAFMERGRAAPDPWRIAIGVAIVVSVAGFAYWQTGSARIGLGFTGMLALSFGVLAGIAQGLAWLARRWFPRRMPYVVRQGVANLHRPNNRTVLLMLALGLGTFLILTLFLARTSLLREIEAAGGEDRPNIMFFDVQDDQIGPLAELARKLGTPLLDRAPVVTMKIAAINGRSTDDLLRDRAAQLPGWTLRREYRSTFRGTLTGTEKIVAGKLVSRVAPDTAVVPVSVEEGLFKDMQLKLGDEITWDVQGVAVRSRVASVRTVQWRRLEPNFFVVFPEGVLEIAPKIFLASARAPTAAAGAQLQREVVAAFPNVSAIDLTLVMQTLDAIFSKVAIVIQFMALFTVATGIIVLAGAVLTGRYQRIRETVLLRTLGATRRQLVRIQLVEYAILGLLAAVVGCILAVIANALLANFVFHIPVNVFPGSLLLAVVAVMAVTLLTGWLANGRIADHPPLEVLRQEM
jgi:putative ABC transport system permease protein